MASTETRNFGGLMKLKKLTCEKAMRCHVCDEQCFHRNYGRIICNACATFVRRSIKQNRDYFCKENGNCRLDIRSKRICMFCRFQKCLKIGLNLNFIMARHQPQQLQLSAKDLLYDETINRFNFAFIQRAWAQKPLKLTTTNESSLYEQFGLLEIEQPLIRHYLQVTGILDMLSENEIESYINCISVYWVFVYTAYYTLRNDGHNQNRLSMIDEKDVFVKPQTSRQFVESVPIAGLQNVDVVSTKLHEVQYTWLNSIKSFHQNQMELSDIAIICHILVLRLAIKMFPKKTEPREHLNRLFHVLRKSLSKKYADAEVRIGNMVLLINDVTNAINEMREFEIVFRLNYFPLNQKRDEPEGLVDYFKQVYNS
ncbi:Nuclear receptor subfamily 2 group E member 1-like isoform X1 [Aphelenchoides besseyi]|nr:Nuclear receptor subfamily 2 group E member 1-like isoform X1 [Aphelenchoides besseyi]